ncbi:MAG TPA: alpha-amylase family glycosyl hydrolase [Chthoniobacterales bacterium]
MKRMALLLTVLALGAGAVRAESIFHPSPPNPHGAEVVYLLMPDRFSRPVGFVTPEDAAAKAGFDPASAGYFHGGNLAGLSERLGYLQHLGVTSVWMTPVFKNRAVQDNGPNRKPGVGYHGYWILDFTDVDPHFGTKDDLAHLFQAATAKHLSIILDAVVNHTADVITAANGQHGYQYKFSHPYRDAAGNVFDDRDYVNRADFPKLDPQVSFPVPPAYRAPADATIKRPDWLNDPTVYHNRGDVSSAGESAQYGDIAGLDDLFTEQLRVVEGMTDIYRRWVRDFPVHGLRLDTVKHVNNEFWQRFLPAMETVARDSGRPDLFLFGEVFDPDPALLSDYVQRAGLPSVLDFGFQKSVVGFAAGAVTAEACSALFAKDAFYITPTGDARGLVTFLSNHDIGRVGYLVGKGVRDGSDEELLQRVKLAHLLLFCARGIPSLYYGDEQGFTGTGGDVDAREDMFATEVAQYAREKRLGGGSPQGAAYDEGHPLYRLIQTLCELRRRLPALRRGAQATRLADPGDSVFAFSRLDWQTGREVLVVANNRPSAREVTIPVATRGGRWTVEFALQEKGLEVTAASGQTVSLVVPGLDAAVLTVDETARGRPEPLGSFHLKVVRQGQLDDRWELTAETTEDRPLQVAFAVRVKGGSAFQYLGTCDAAPYCILPTRERVPVAAELEFRCEARDLDGNGGVAEATWQKPNPRLPGTGDR